MSGDELHPNSGEGSSGESLDPPDTTPVAPGTILLVDDIPENLRVLSEMLMRSGYSPRPVTSGKAALKVLASVPVDLILLDVHMPGMTGYDLCSQLKQTPAYRDIPILFLSAAADTDHKVEAFLRGGVDYIDKPFQFEEVRARVETHLRLRKLQLEQRALLERTLAGAVVTLMDGLQMASPLAFGRATVVRDCVLHLAEGLHIAEPWAFRVSGALAFLGCLALPEAVLDQAFAGGPKSPEVQAAFERHAEAGRRLLAGIPRLERVAAVIGAQYGGPLPQVDRDMQLVARVLRVAQAYCQARFDGATLEQARLAAWERFPDERVLHERLESFTREPKTVAIKGELDQLTAGCVMARVVKTADGLLLFRAGDAVSEVSLLRLAEYVRAGRVPNAFVFHRPLTSD